MFQKSAFPSLLYKFRYFLSIAGLLVLFPVAGQALPEVDRDAIRAVIQAQLDAFQADDAQRAFSFASPSIQDRFATPARFLAMVKASYQPVYRPRSAVFQETIVDQDVVAQQVLLVDSNDQLFMAVYPMEKQPDGTWRIAGCYLTPAKGLAL